MRRSPCTWTLAVLAGLVGPALAQDGGALRDALALEKAFQDAIRKAEKSVACVLVSRPAPVPDMRRGRMEPEQEAVPDSFGSGVVIDPRGLILTNYHVVRDVAEGWHCEVRLPDTARLRAVIHAADPRSDLAVLRVERSGRFPAIRVGDADRVRKGQFVLTIANPFAAGYRDGSPSASWGIVSNVRRRAAMKVAPTEPEFARRPLSQFGTLLQTDARLNLGSSGGALVNLHGELIGLTTALAGIGGGETAGGFAIPIDGRMRPIIDALRAGREVEYGFLGVTFEGLGGSDGVRVGRIVAGSPAARAGLRPYDVITAVDGDPIRDTDDLMLTISTHLAGSEARLRVAGRAEPVIVALAKLNVSGPPPLATNRPAPVRGLRVDYTSVLYLRDGGPGIVPGVAVREVEAGSPAEAARLQDAVITQVNGHAVNTPAEFYREAARAAGPLELTVAGRGSDGGPRTVKLE